MGFQPSKKERCRVNVAVVDIGSNSVRLVIFDKLSRAPVSIFNDKQFCALGRDIGSSGRINPEALKETVSTLERFRRIIGLFDVVDCHVVATAAVRDAENGHELMDAVIGLFGDNIHLLDGKREAELAGMGAMSGIFQANGIVGDLGGGSLELIDVMRNQYSRPESYPIGVLRLKSAASNHSADIANQMVEKYLANSECLKGLEGRKFIAVGGSWRALGRLHLFEKNYPLRIIHEYSVRADIMAKFCREVQKKPIESYDSINNINQDRWEMIAYGAQLMEYIIKLSKPKRVVFSSSGVREGVLFEELQESQRRHDPLYIGCRELGQLTGGDPAYSVELENWTEKAVAGLKIAETSNLTRLRKSASYIMETSWRVHPEYRGVQACNIIGTAALLGADHKERAFLAACAYFRHEGPGEEKLPVWVKHIVTRKLLRFAQLVGALARLAHAVSAGKASLLEDYHVGCDERGLVLLRNGAIASEFVTPSSKVFNRLNKVEAAVSKFKSDNPKKTSFPLELGG